MGDSFHFDYGEFLLPPYRTDDGYLLVDGTPTRVGVFDYHDPSQPDNTRRELRLPGEVFAEDSMASLAEKPITRGHPPKPLNSRNVKQHEDGNTSREIERYNGHVRVKGAIRHDVLVDEVESGERDKQSCGYKCRVVDNSGTWVDEDGLIGEPGVSYEYDAVQRDIRYNHVAMVKNPRAGNTATVRTDGITPGTVARVQEPVFRMDAGAKNLGFPDAPIRNESNWSGDAAKRDLKEYASSDGSGDKDTIDWDRYARGFLVQRGDGQDFGDYSFPVARVDSGGELYIPTRVLQVLTGSRGIQHAPDSMQSDLRDAISSKARSARRKFDDFDWKPEWERDDSRADSLAGLIRSAVGPGGFTVDQIDRLSKGLGVTPEQVRNAARFDGLFSDDSNEGSTMAQNGNESNDGDKSTAQVRVDDVSYDANPALAQAVSDLKSDRNDAVSRLDSVIGRMDELESELEIDEPADDPADRLDAIMSAVGELQGTVETLQDERMDEDEIREYADERVELLAVASELGVGVEHNDSGRVTDGNETIKKRIVADQRDTTVDELDDRMDGYVNGAYEQIARNISGGDAHEFVNDAAERLYGGRGTKSDDGGGSNDDETSRDDSGGIRPPGDSGGGSGRKTPESGGDGGFESIRSDEDDFNESIKSEDPLAD